MRGLVPAGGLSILLTICASGIAVAEDPEALIKQGVALRKAGDDVRAEGYFRRAHELAGTPRTAAQLGLVEVALGAYVKAEGYLSEALGSDDAWVLENRAALEDGRIIARSHLMRIEVLGAAGGTKALINDRDWRTVPSSGAIWVEPGPLSITIESHGRAVARFDVSGAAGDVRRLNLSIEADSHGNSIARVSTVANSPERSSVRTVGAIVVGATGVGTAVLGIWLFDQGRSKKGAIERAAVNEDPYDPSDGDWRTMEHRGIACMVGGGLVLGASLVFYVATAGRDPASHLVSQLSAQGASIGWKGTF